MSLIRKHVAVLQAWACLALVYVVLLCAYSINNMLWSTKFDYPVASSTNFKAVMTGKRKLSYHESKTMPQSLFHRFFSVCHNAAKL